MPSFSKFNELLTKIADFFSLELNNRISFVFIFAMTATIVIDSTIVEFFSFSGIRAGLNSNIAIFIGLSLVFAIGGILLINCVKTITSKSSYKLPKNVKHFYYVIFGTQIIIIAIISITTFQIIIFNKYHIMLLQAVTYISHVLALVFAIPLIYLLIKWFGSRRNYIILLYIMSISLVCVNILVSLIYYEKILLRSYSTEIRPYPISTYVTAFYSQPEDQILVATYNTVFIISFLVVWIATMALINQYRYKIGNIRYYALIIMPLIYFVFPFHTYFANLLSPFVLNSPVTVSVIYTILFSSTKQVGAFLFSFSFLLSSAVVSREYVRKSLLISCLGMTLFYSCVEITPLQYKILPPYGIITEAFIPLAAFLLLVGIFTSAISISQDADLRRDLHKTAMTQLDLLRTIGISEMEKILLKKFKSAEKLTSDMETDEDRFSDDDVRQTVHEVLEELKKRDLTRQKSTDK